MSSILLDLRQLRFPRELRIADPEIELAPVSLGEVADLFPDDRSEPDGGGDPAPPGPRPDELNRRFAIQLATTAWRLRRQIERLDPEPGAPLRRRVKALEELLDENGLQILDYSGERFDPQETWDAVVGTESNNEFRIVTAMQEPRIVYRGAYIQLGTPIVDDP